MNILAANSSKSLRGGSFEERRDVVEPDLETLATDHHSTTMMMEEETSERRLLWEKDQEIRRLQQELANVRLQLQEAQRQLCANTTNHDDDLDTAMGSQLSYSNSMSTFEPSATSSGVSLVGMLWNTAIVEDDQDDASVDALSPIDIHSNNQSSHQAEALEIGLDQPVLYPPTREREEQLETVAEQPVYYPPTGDQEDELKSVVGQPVLDHNGDKGVYTGTVSKRTGWPHGNGKLEYEDKGKGRRQRVYEGEWKDGRWHGTGKARFASGDTYDGSYKYDQRHGYGVYLWADKRCYAGEFYEDKRQGHGTFHWPNGAVYEGDFVLGQREGQGTYSFDGCKYVGGWKDGCYHGVGTCVWSDGRCFSGHWVNGLRDGQGIETGADGEVRHDGQWAHDKPLSNETDVASNEPTANDTDHLASEDAPSKARATKTGKSRMLPRWMQKKTAESD